MSDKHLAKDDALPPLSEDTLRIYSMRWCPFAQRTRLVLAHKQISYETVNVNLSNKPDWLFEKNPLGLVPVLEKNNQIIYESAICNEYLEETHPDMPLYPKDPYTKARIKILMEQYSKVVPRFHKIMKLSAGEEKTTVLNEIVELLEIFENDLGEKTFFGGSDPNILDYHMWPWFERIPDMDILLPKNKVPKLNAWTSSMKNHPVVKVIAETIELHGKFIDSYMQGKPVQYDV